VKIGDHELQEDGRRPAFEPGRVHARVFGNGNGFDEQTEEVLQLPRTGAERREPRPAGVVRVARHGYGGRNGRYGRHGGRRCQKYQSAEREQLQGNGETVSVGLREGIHGRVSVTSRRRIRRGGLRHVEPVFAAVEKRNAAVGVFRGQV